METLVVCTSNYDKEEYLMEDENYPDEIYTLEEFIAYSKAGILSDSDGIGEALDYDGNEISVVVPSDVVVKGYTFPLNVCTIKWFSK